MRRLNTRLLPRSNDQPCLLPGRSLLKSKSPVAPFFKGGEVVDRFVGVQPKARLQQALDAAKG